MRCFWIGAGMMVLIASTAVAGEGVSLSKDQTGHLVVPVLVDGKGPYPFMLDTGADKSAVYGWFAAALALPRGHRSEISGATGNAAETTSRVRSLTLAGHEIRNVDADTLPDRPDGTDIAGIAGVDLLAARVAVLDPACGTFALLSSYERPARVAGPGATLVRAGRIQGGRQLTFDVTLNGVPGLAILDSGARATIINSRFARLAGVDADAGDFATGPTTRGATQQGISSVVGTIGDVGFAGIIRPSVVARVADLSAFNDADLRSRAIMNVGADLLAELRLTIDYDHRRFWVSPTRCVVQHPGSS